MKIWDVKKITQYISWRSALIAGILMLIVFFRFLWIDRIPPGMQFDEVEYALSSKTYQLMGEDLSGTSFPKSLLVTDTMGNISPIPPLTMSILWHFLDLNMTTYRSFYVVLNLFTAVAFSFLAYELFKQKYIAAIGGILFLLNPWSIFFSRHGIDGAFVLLFYLLGMLFFLKKNSKKNYIFSLVFFLLGFFSYHGAKIQLIPLIGILSLYKYSLLPKIKRRVNFWHIGILCFFIASLVFFLVGGNMLSGSIVAQRSRELVFSDMNRFAGQVDSLRSASIDTPIAPLLINKGVMTAQYIVNFYLQAFSPQNLFFSAEIMKFQGFFYTFEIILFFIGIALLHLKNKRVFYLILGIIIIAPLSTAISTSGFSILNRGVLLLPAILLTVTYALSSIQTITSLKIKLIVSGSLIGMYTLSFLIFQYYYFFVLPIQLNSHYHLSTRALVRYLELESERGNSIVVSTNTARDFYSRMVFHASPNLQADYLQQRFTVGESDNFQYRETKITNRCVDLNVADATIFVIHRSKLDCYNKEIDSKFIFIDKIDASPDYFIIGGTACKDQMLNRYTHPHLISDLDIDRMDRETFCKRWVADSGIDAEKEFRPPLK